MLYPTGNSSDEGREVTSTITKTEKAEALARMHEWVSPGDELVTILRHVSRSGMMRRISVIAVDKENGRHAISDYTWNVARILGCSIDRDSYDGGMRVNGCGMDMGFHAVYSLSRALYPDGFECVGEDCPSNDHSNGDRDYTPHHHSDGGYALRQRWL